METSITSLQTVDIKDNLIVGRYSTACGSYNDLLDRGLLLTRKLLNQGFLVVTLKSLLRKLDGRHHDLPNRWSICVINDQILYMFRLSLSTSGSGPDLSPDLYEE